MTKPNDFGSGTTSEKGTPLTIPSSKALMAYWTTDTNQLFVENKDRSAWVEVPTGSSSGGGGDYAKLDEIIADGTLNYMEITNISQAYRDLEIVIRGRADVYNANGDFHLKLTNKEASGAFYDSGYVAGGSNSGFNPTAQGGDTTSSVSIPGPYVAGTSSGNFYSTQVVTVLDYTDTTTDYKEYYSHFRSPHGIDGGANSHQGVAYYVWGNINYANLAVSVVSVQLAAGNFVAGSRLSIYGRK